MWVDALKGFLMILVVRIGHSPGELDFPLITYIYWFDMPAFFLLSGLFFKEIAKNESSKAIIKKKIYAVNDSLLILLFFSSLQLFDIASR